MVTKRLPLNPRLSAQLDDGASIDVHNLVMFEAWPGDWAPDLLHEVVISAVNDELWVRWRKKWSTWPSPNPWTT
jgi:hypothetical protein